MKFTNQAQSHGLIRRVEFEPKKGKETRKKRSIPDVGCEDFFGSS